MYETFYGLEESPFSLTPDSKFLFMSEQHRAAMAALLYGLEQRKGFICLSGEVGSGKTTLCRALVNRLRTRNFRIGVILNSYLSDIELLRTINDEFGLDSHFDSKKDLIDVLNGFLIEENRKGNIIVLIIDEAQNLPRQTLEQIRMLGNLESETTKLFQIVLVGQPELNEILSRPDFEQLDSRISVRFHLRALGPDEVLHYIRHRLFVAGSRKHIDFTTDALQKIATFSRGIPRRVNQLCDRCLLVGFVADSFAIDGKMVDQAISEVSAPLSRPVAADGSASPSAPVRFHGLKIAATLLISLGVLGGAMWFTLIEKPAGLKAAGVKLKPSRAETAPVIQKKTAKPLLTSDTLTHTSSTQPSKPASQPASQPATSAPADLVREVDGVKLLSDPPVMPPASSAPASAPVLTTTTATSAPVTEPAAKDLWVYDKDAVMRVKNREVSQLAAVLTIGRLWDKRGDPSKLRSKNFAYAVGLDALAYARDTLKMKVDDYGTNFDAAVRTNLPVLVQMSDVDGTPRYASVMAVFEEEWLVGDPLNGMQSLTRSQLNSRVKHAWVLYRDNAEFSHSTRAVRLVKE